jgi:isoquinoline 1-oxidoreductase beta subunit
MTETKLNRRDFLKVLGATGASLMIGIYLGGCDSDQTSTALPAGILEPNIYVKIDSSNTVTITAFRSEMGQGIRTAIAMILAEELDVDWDTVVIDQAFADARYGNQVTGGSASISSNYSTLRMAGGAVRQLLINAAAQVWGIDPADCTTQLGVVIHPDGVQKFSYGELAATASGMKLPDLGEYILKSEQEFRLIGTGMGHWDALEIVTGKAIYGFDVKLPEMLYATIARSPVFGGSIASFDGSKALTVPGVVSVQVIDNWVAVVAENTWAAIQGRTALEVTWEGGNPELNSESIRAELAARAPAEGSVADGQIDAIYEFPYQAHAPMEPMNCTAYVSGETCELWVPTQSAQDVQRAVQSALRFGRDSVTVHVTLMGGGFGRRLQTDYAVEAALVSQAIGVPVQVIWTRDDDIRHDFYHPLSYQYVSGNPQESGRPRVQSYDGAPYIPTGAWRSVGEHPAAYARECFIDEMAAASHRDPLELRREMYNGRALAVIDLAAEKAGWGDPLPEGWGRGIAYHATFGVTHVAMVAEVEVADGQIRVHRVVCAVDCGVAVNPDTITAQMEGGVAFGLTAALKAGVTVVDGGIQESNFHDCPMLQIDEMPQVEVYIIKTDNNPTGIGEMGVPPVAPALANAVFAATGKRVRHLPIRAADLA